MVSDETREKLEALMSAVVPACNAYMLLKGRCWGDTADAEKKMVERMDYLCTIASEIERADGIVCRTCDFCEPRKLRCRRLDTLPYVGEFYDDGETAPEWCPLRPGTRGTR